MKAHSQFGFWSAMIISALGTGAFFMVYVSALVPESWIGGGFIHDLATALIGVLLLDGAAYLWQRTLHDNSVKTPRQIGIANGMAIASLFAAGLMSVSWFILSMVLVPDGPIVEMAGWLGVIVVIAATFAQFAAWFFYRHYSPESIAARVRAEEDAADQEEMLAEVRRRRSAARKSSADALAEMEMTAHQERNRRRVRDGAVPPASSAPASTYAADAPAPISAKTPVPKAPGRRQKV